MALPDVPLVSIENPGVVRTRHGDRRQFSYCERALRVGCASALLFGGSLFMAPSAVTAVTRRHFPTPAWAPVITIFTTLFSALQAPLPLPAGGVADRFGLEAGFALGSSLLLPSCITAPLQQHLP